MVDFVEKATLLVVDKSSKSLRKVNRELVKLTKSAKAAGKLKIELRGLAVSARKVNALNDAIRRLPTSKTVNIRVNKGALKSIAPTTVPVSPKLVGKGAFNTALRASLKTKVPFTVPVHPKLAGKTQFNTELRTFLKKSHTVDVKPSVTGGSGGATASGGSGGVGLAGAAAVGTGLVGPRRGRLAPLSTTAFPGNLPAAFNIATAYLTVRAFTLAGQTALKATVEGQSVETQTELVVADPAVVNELKTLGRSFARNASQVTIARGREIAKDLYVTGFRGEVLASVGAMIARLEGAAIGANPQKAGEITLLANKMGNLAAVTDDPLRAAKLAEGIFKASLLQGETFSASAMISALRIAGVAQGIDEQGLLRFATATDELGKSVGIGTKRLVQVLTTSLDQAGAGSGVAKGIVKSLISAGLRGKDGVADNELLSRDPLRFVEEVIGKKLRDQGIDARDTDQRAAAKKALTAMGIQGTALRLVLNELAAGAERDKSLALAQGMDPSRVNTAASDDLGFQIKEIITQFKSFSSETLNPLFEVMAPAASDVAAFLKELSFAEGLGGQMQRIGLVIGTAASAIVAARLAISGFQKLSGMGGLTTAGTTLTKAGFDLSRAAAMMNAAGAGAGAGAGLAGAAGAGAVAGNRGVLMRIATNLPLIATGMGAIAEMDRTAGMTEKERIAERDANDAKITRGAEKWLDSTLGPWFVDTFATRQDDLDARKAIKDAEVTATQADAIAAALKANLYDPVSPVTAVEQATGLTDLTEDQAGLISELKYLRQEFANAKRLGDRGGFQTQILQTQINEVLTGLKDQGIDPTAITGDLGETISPLQQAFASHVDGLSAVAPALDASAAQFGPTAAQGLLAMGPQIGVAIGNAAAAIIERAGINMPSMPTDDEPRLDTGASMPY